MYTPKQAGSSERTIYKIILVVNSNDCLDEVIIMWHNKIIANVSWIITTVYRHYLF